MKRNWNMCVALLAALSLVTFVSNASAQYGSGACAPTCDVPTVSYAPTCDVPEVPTCEPTCDVPSCGLSCDASYGCETGSCGYGCYTGACCLDACGLVTGALNVAVSPFKWVYCELTDGIFPDCGCAPRPPKTACNPCTICGDYAGGCNDNCEAGVCGACNECAGGYYSQAQNAYTSSYSAGAYSSQVYDVEQYDASPTRGTKAVPKLPIYGSRNDLSAIQRVQNFNIQDVVGNTRRASSVRSVGYEQNAKQASRPVQAQALVKAQPNAQVRPASQNAPSKAQLPKIQKTQKLQNKDNVRIVAHTPADAQQSSTSKTFGQTRPVK